MKPLDTVSPLPDGRGSVLRGSVPARALISACLALLLMPAAACLGAITITKVETTATQALMAYTPPDDNACTLQVSQNASLMPLVPDVDPAIFTGANSDLSRPSTVTAGLSREVVIGQRTAQLATAGQYTGLRHFSRALQANTLHYVMITCPSTGDTISFNLQTTNIPLGNTYGDPWLWDPAIAGNQPWPETLGASTTESFVDPLTGLLLQRVSVRGNGYGYWPSMPFSTAHNQNQAPCSATGGWTNPCNVLGSSGYASIGNSTNWLVLRNAMTTGNAWGGYNGSTSSYATCCQIDQLQFNLTGYIPGCSGATCQVDACISMNDGASCAGPIQTVTFGTSLSTQSFGSASTSQFGATPWAFDTNPRFNVEESTVHQGQATVSGTTLTWQSGSPFSLYWINSTLRLSTSSQADACTTPPVNNTSTEYTVDSFLDGDNLVLSSAPGNGTYYFCAQPFSIMVRRHAADSNTVYVQSANMGALESGFPVYPSNGANTAVFSSMVGGGWFVSFGGMFWVNPTTSEVRYYGNPYMQPGPAQNPWLGSRGCPGPNAAFWDNTQTVPTWYCSSTENGKYVVIRGRILGGVPAAYTAPYSDLAFESGCSATDSYTITCAIGGGVTVVWDILTPTSLNQDLNTQLAAFDAGISAKLTAWASTESRVDQLAEKGIFYTSFLSTGAQDSPGIMLAFNPGDGVPAHAGQAGGPALAGAITTYNTGPVITLPVNFFPSTTPGVPTPPTSAYGRTLHALIETGGTGYVAMTMNNASYATVNTTHTVIPASSSTTCASFGVTGNTNPCIQLQIDSYTHNGVTGYEPYLTNSISGSNLFAPFTGVPGEFRTMQIGDLACVEYANGNSPLASNQCAYQGAEMMMLVTKGANGLWTFQRGMYGTTQARNSGAQVGLWWSAFETGEPYQAQVNALTAYWNPLTGCSGSPDPHGNCMIQDTNENGAHEFVRDGSATGAVNIPAWAGLASGPANGQWPFGYRSTPGVVPGSISLPWANNMPGGVPGVSMVHGNPAFAGATGGAWSGEASTHPNPPAALASAYEQQFAFDDVTFSGAASFGLDPTFTNVSGQLYVATVAVTDPDDIGYLNRKILPTAASCGNHPLADVSGPGSLMDGSAGNSYRYCIPRASGECQSGSTVGKVYVNCPGLIPPLTCNGSGLHGSAQLGVGNDVCVHNAAAPMNVISQIAISQMDKTGAGRRTLVSDIGRIRMSAGFDNARLLPDNSGLLFMNWWSDLQTSSTWMAHMLPLNHEHSVDGTKFVPYPVDVTPPSDAQVNTAIIEFGYAEYGDPNAFNCTTRADTCVANQATIPASNAPFQFASESPAWLSCSNGCTIWVPAISQRVLFYRIKYYTSSNQVIIAKHSVIVVP